MICLCLHRRDSIRVLSLPPYPPETWRLACGEPPLLPDSSEGMEKAVTVPISLLDSWTALLFTFPEPRMMPRCCLRACSTRECTSLRTIISHPFLTGWPKKGALQTAKKKKEEPRGTTTTATDACIRVRGWSRALPQTTIHSYPGETTGLLLYCNRLRHARGRLAWWTRGGSTSSPGMHG